MHISNTDLAGVETRIDGVSSYQSSANHFYGNSSNAKTVQFDKSMTPVTDNDVDENGEPHYLYKSRALSASNPSAVKRPQTVYHLNQVYS
jgi:hypothetical protein